MFDFILKLMYSALFIAFSGLFAGVLFAIIPRTIFLKCEKYFPLLKYEQNGKFYNRVFKINLWKDKLPQFSELTKIGFSKTSLNNSSPEYLKAFHAETIRAEITHLFLIITSPLCFYFNTKIFTLLTFFSIILGNIPFLMIQRYNRARIRNLIVHLQKKHS